MLSQENKHFKLVLILNDGDICSTVKLLNSGRAFVVTIEGWPLLRGFI